MSADDLAGLLLRLAEELAKRVQAAGKLPDALDRRPNPDERWVWFSLTQVSELAYEGLGISNFGPLDGVSDDALASVLVLLDDWFSPLNPGMEELPPRPPQFDSDLFESLEERLRMAGRLFPPLGVDAPALLIPAGRLGASFDPKALATAGVNVATVALGLVAAKLRHVIPVPSHVTRSPMVAANDRQPPWRGEVPQRVALQYRRALTDPAKPRAGQLKIAIAPIMESWAEGKFVPVPDRQSYSVRHDYDPGKRVADVLDAAAQADILLFPEMALSEAGLAVLSRELKSRFSQSQPSPELVSAGVLGTSKVGPGSNRVYHLSRDGQVLMVQDKLSPWDLNENDRMRLGLAGWGDGLILEDIGFGATIHLVDTPLLGRLMSYICADINDDLPADYLIQAAGVDWVHAPIMDHSTCWALDAANGRCIESRWSVRRALRAARQGVRLIVTNSLAMTEQANRHNQESGNTGYVLQDCGIGLLAEAIDGHAKVCHAKVALQAAASPNIRIVNWPSDRQPWGCDGYCIECRCAAS
ncbi:hypothetical protein CHU93_13630 [Sandarakinorhabdus cyanobacteriorum]|uniref:Uncharacterized protein n=1 Tax=Sandarakinorhabdus cyanobacteriorum TaxID=1981098 RepID=A0A255Y943_9SPHN|nr:hypothetical protein [Sandarakinorhabdus cyanobacteriorum]OYQ25757.1 hypothetical protein CHU93_13630 [Sandarakinorhabdus cyanobacteriorum]